MGREGLMTPEEAERKVWEFYWQLDNARDRRTAPIKFEPPDELHGDERDYEAGLWGTVQWQKDQFVKKVARLKRKTEERIFGDKRRRDYRQDAMSALISQAQSDRNLRGQVDQQTGLPLSANDLAVGRAVIYGMALCLEATIPPEQLAASCTAWLPPCPAGENPESWGGRDEDWQAMGYKPRDISCEVCKGTGKIRREVTSRFSGMFRIRLSKPKCEVFPCEECKGRGSRNNWTDEEVQTIQANAYQIKLTVRRLAESGFFHLQPTVNPSDPEMNDLVWEDDAGLPLAFKMTPAGYEEMKRMCEEDDALRSTCRQHILSLAGREIREKAPQWAVDEYRSAN